MGYPKYDKEEAKRVYEESVAKHKAESDELSRQALRGVKHLLIGFFLLVLVVYIVIKVVDEQPKTYTVTTRESVVITKFRLLGGKSTTFVVEYYTVIGAEHGEFETQEISFAVGDTIKTNVNRIKEIEPEE